MDSDRLAVRGRFGIPVGLAQCLACSHFYTLPRLSPKYHAQALRRWFWPFYFPQSNPANRHLDEYVRGKRALQFVRTYYGEPSSWHDFGCGTGGVIAAVGEQGLEAQGHDPDAEALAFGCRVGLSISKDLNTSKVDIISLMRVLHFFPEFGGLFQDLVAKLGPGGLVYIEQPGLRRWLRGGGCRGRFERLASPFHYHYFDLAHLRYLFSMHGFRLLAGSDAIQALFVYEPGYYWAQADFAASRAFLKNSRRFAALWWILSFLPVRVRHLVDWELRGSKRIVT